MIEVWKPIPEGNDYFVSNHGSVMSLKRKNPRLINARIKKGYLQVILFINGKHVSRHVHCLVAASFLGARPKDMVVCHLDGNRTNNDLTNLRYDTRINNEADKITHGTYLCGERASGAKLSASDVAEIRSLLSSSTQTAVAKLYGVSQTTISRIYLNQTWHHS